MCDLDVHIVFRDRDTGRLIEYESINADGEHFKLDLAKSLVDKIKACPVVRNYKLYTDDDYQSLQVNHKTTEKLEDIVIMQSQMIID